LITGNRFGQNQGGDLVNTDGNNVWFEDNDCDQTGLVDRQTDGPIVHWGRADQVVRGNTITVTVGSSNGRWGLIGYSRNDPDREGFGTRQGNLQPNYFENNTFIGGGLHMARTGDFVVRHNVFEGATILGYNIDCVRLEANDVTAEQEAYKLRNVSGEASGNMRNGEPIEFLMADDCPYTNSPPSLW
jgi:poly(beta-D-mannuronate) C5 epimerase